MELTKSKWNQEEYQTFLVYLKSYQDEKYRLFTKKLVTTQKEIIGIRTPILRKIAKEIGKGNIESFLDEIESNYHEEILLEGFLISELKDPMTSYSYFKKYLSKIDNWATCDSFCNSYKIVKKNLSFYYPIILDLVNEEETYSIRVGLVLLLNYYIKEEYLQTIFQITNRINSNEYYVKMAIAWLLSMCYVKYPKETKNYFFYHQLSTWTYQKTLQKIIESNRVSIEEKEYFRQRKKELSSK